MPRISRKGAEEARAQLPALLADAEKGRATVITRHGRGVAALVPLKDFASARQASLTPLAGSGKGMWGDASQAVGRLRDEWKN